VGEEQLVEVGKWSTNLALLDIPVSSDTSVTSVTVALTDKGHTFNPNWEFQVYQRSGSQFQLLKKQAFKVDVNVTSRPQTIQLQPSVSVVAGSLLAVYCKESYIALKCNSKESIKYKVWYGSPPSSVGGTTQGWKSWEGRMGFCARVSTQGVAIFIIRCLCLFTHAFDLICHIT
jgi:hypothetical protein